MLSGNGSQTKGEKDNTIMVSKVAPLIILDKNYDACMAKNGKDTKHT